MLIEAETGVETDAGLDRRAPRSARAHGLGEFGALFADARLWRETAAGPTRSLVAIRDGRDLR